MCTINNHPNHRHQYSLLQTTSPRQIHWWTYWTKRNRATILVIIFWNFLFWYRSDLPQVKRNFISSTANLVYELPQELPNDLRFGILGIFAARGFAHTRKKKTWDIRKLENIRKISNLEKSQRLVPSVSSRNSTLAIVIKNGCQTFLFLSNITGFLYFVLGL